MQIDFTNLNDVYHLTMIIVGMGALVFAGIMLFYFISKDKKKKRK